MSAYFLGIVLCPLRIISRLSLCHVLKTEHFELVNIVIYYMDLNKKKMLYMRIVIYSVCLFFWLKRKESFLKEETRAVQCMSYHNQSIGICLQGKQNKN